MLALKYNMWSSFTCWLWKWFFITFIRENLNYFIIVIAFLLERLTFLLGKFIFHIIYVWLLSFINVYIFFLCLFYWCLSYFHIYICSISRFLTKEISCILLIIQRLYVLFILWWIQVSLRWILLITLLIKCSIYFWRVIWVVVKNRLSKVPQLIRRYYVLLLILFQVLDWIFCFIKNF